MGQGEYVCRLEPATHAMGPRNKLADNGLTRSLSPNEHVEYELKLTVYENN